MTESIEELRAWAAGVCGYEHGFTDIHGTWQPDSSWLPDQNIAQAMEVVDALVARIRGENEPHKWVDFELRYITWISDKTQHCGFKIGWCGGQADANHENRCMAILLACHAAHKAMSEVKHVEN